MAELQATMMARRWKIDLLSWPDLGAARGDQIGPAFEHRMITPPQPFIAVSGNPAPWPRTPWPLRGCRPVLQADRHAPERLAYRIRAGPLDM
jgi:hypothetical protein